MSKIYEIIRSGFYSNSALLPAVLLRAEEKGTVGPIKKAELTKMKIEQNSR